MITSTRSHQTRTSLPWLRPLSRTLALVAVFAAVLTLSPNCFGQSWNYPYVSSYGYTAPYTNGFYGNATGCCRLPSPSVVVLPHSSPSVSVLPQPLSIPAQSPVFVHGYVRQNGTYVQPHYRSAPDGIRENNWSTWGNVNPYTGKGGTRR